MRMRVRQFHQRWPLSARSRRPPREPTRTTTSVIRERVGRSCEVERPAPYEVPSPTGQPLDCLPQGGVVDGLDIWAEYARLLTLETWQGRFDVVNPRLLLRWATKPPTTRSWRLGSANIVGWWVRLNLHPGLTSQDVRETMVHELAHLFIGLRRTNGQNEWHGVEFQTAMRKGFAEAYGVWVDVAHKARFGGQYAAALVAQPHT